MHSSHGMVTISISGYPSTWFLFIPSTNGIIPTIILMISLNDVWYVFSRYSKKEKGTDVQKVPLNVPNVTSNRLVRGALQIENWQPALQKKWKTFVSQEEHLFHKIPFQKMTDLPVALFSQLVVKYFQMPGVYSLFSSTDSIRWWYE